VRRSVACGGAGVLVVEPSGRARGSAVPPRGFESAGARETESRQAGRRVVEAQSDVMRPDPRRRTAPRQLSASQASRGAGAGVARAAPTAWAAGTPALHTKLIAPGARLRIGPEEIQRRWSRRCGSPTSGGCACACAAPLAPSPALLPCSPGLLRRAAPSAPPPCWPCRRRTWAPSTAAALPGGRLPLPLQVRVARGSPLALQVCAPRGSPLALQVRSRLRPAAAHHAPPPPQAPAQARRPRAASGRWPGAGQVTWATTSSRCASWRPTCRCSSRCGNARRLGAWAAAAAAAAALRAEAEAPAAGPAGLHGRLARGAAVGLRRRPA
jgi:hypothetical protein